MARIRYRADICDNKHEVIKDKTFDTKAAALVWAYGNKGDGAYYEMWSVDDIGNGLELLYNSETGWNY